MEKIKICESFHPVLNRELVFRMLDCFPDSPVYEEMMDVYERLQWEIPKFCEPKGVLALGWIPLQYSSLQKQEVIYALVTIGAKISEKSAEAFAGGDYVEGMMIDAMADSMLFSLEEDIQRELREFSAGWGKGICKRLEIPRDLPMEIQKEAMEQTEAEKRLGLRLSRGYMFWPLKTVSQIYLTTDRADEFQARHDCSVCPNTGCGLRQV